MSEHRLGSIVIERPRHGRRISLKKVTGYKKYLQKITQEASDDGLLCPYLIKSRKRTKYFSDHISPLYRWLRSQVGQSWDTVYSKLCQKLDLRTLSGQHILAHVWDFVERNVVIIDGIPDRQHRQDYPLNPFWRWREQLYIHPDTGVLCKVERKARKVDRKSDDLVVIDKYHQYRKIDDVWYFVIFADFPTTASECQVRDILQKTLVNLSSVQQIYGDKIYAVSKNQCSKKEIKFILQQLHCLENKTKLD
jgi:hypothetical protein